MGSITRSVFLNPGTLAATRWLTVIETKTYSGAYQRQLTTSPSIPKEIAGKKKDKQKEPSSGNEITGRRLKVDHNLGTFVVLLVLKVPKVRIARAGKWFILGPMVRSPRSPVTPAYTLGRFLAYKRRAKSRGNGRKKTKNQPLLANH